MAYSMTADTDNIGFAFSNFQLSLIILLNRVHTVFPNCLQVRLLTSAAVTISNSLARAISVVLVRRIAIL